MIKAHLREKRNEIIWSLLQQGYSQSDCRQMFNMSKANMHDVHKKLPEKWESPWVKRIHG